MSIRDSGSIQDDRNAAYAGEPISCPPLTHYKTAEACPDRAKHTSDPPGKRKAAA